MDPIIVDLPDGGTAEFPAGTDHATIKSALAKRYPAPAPEPSMGRRALDAANTGVGWLRTRSINAATGLANSAFTPMTPIKEIAQRVGGEDVNRFLKYAYPDAGTMRDAIYKGAGVREVNTPGTAGKIFDTGVEAAITAPLFPGGPIRNMVAGFGGGVGSEGAGQATKGTRWEPAARLIGGVVGGALGAAGAEATAAAGRGLRNTFGANDTDKTAARVISRGLERDKIAPADVPNRMLALGEDAMPMDAGGPNTRGVLRGATAAPGEARTTVQSRFDARADKEAPAVSGSVDRNISPKGLTGAVDDLVTARRNAAGPAYEAAGVPSDPKAYPGAPVLTGPGVKALIADSADIKDAIKAVRRLPAYKDLPDTSMVMLDEAYKRLGDMSQAARDQFGKATHGSRKIDDLRVTFAAAIDAENPNYGLALKAFSEPSKLIDAANDGQKAFAANTAPAAVARDFKALSPDAQEAFLVGVAEHLNKRADARGATGIAGRVINPRDAQRLQAILPPDRYQAFIKDIETQKTFTANQRDVGAGSRTTPMALEAADTAAQVAGDAVGKLVQGRPVGAVMSALSSITKRIGDGANERVNARVADWLTNAAPESKRALIDALERSLLDQRVASPGNTFKAGIAAPALAAPVNQPREDRRGRPR